MDEEYLTILMNQTSSPSIMHEISIPPYYYIVFYHFLTCTFGTHSQRTVQFGKFAN